MKRTTTYQFYLLLVVLALLGEASKASAQGWYNVFLKNDTAYGGVALDARGINGGYVMTGYGVRNDSSHLITLQTDLEGQITHYQEYTYGHSIPARGGSLAIFPDGSFNLLAMHGPGFSVDSTLVIHVGANGQEIWRHYLSTSGNNFAWAIEPLAGNECVVSGVFENQVTFIRLNAAGEEVWRLQQGPPGSRIYSDSHFFAFCQIAPGIYAQGYEIDTLPNVIGGLIDTVIAFNVAGFFEPILPNYLQETDDGRRIQRVITQPNGFLLAISSHMQGNEEIARRINPQGEVIAEYKTSYYDNTIPFFDAQVAPTRDGGFVVGGIDAGLVSEFGIRLSRFDEWGHLKWTTAIPFGTYEDASGGNYDIYSVAEGAVPGTYLLSGTMAVGSWAKHLLIVTDSLGRIKPGTFFGSVRQDVNGDCQPQSNETRLGGWQLALEDLADGRQRYARTDDQGNYAFQADTAIQHLLQVVPPNPYWTSCLNDTLVSVPRRGDTTTVHFSMHPVVDCPFLEVSIGTPLLRRCFYNTYTVQYCNTGTAPAEDAYIRITLDPYLALQSADLPYTLESYHVWRFALGSIPTGFCGRFSLMAYLDCDSTILGQTHCVEARIYPDSLCISPDNWSGATVDVDGSCQPDSVRFFIRNTGTAITSTLDYVVIEDNIINYQGHFTLPAGDSLLIAVPANGHTWRVEAEQEPGSPYDPMPSATVEACGVDSLGVVSLGFVSQFGESDGDPFVSIACQSNIGSFDPNEKFAAPQGYGPEHYILPNQPLEYQISFQNTGTDTAFLVIVRDTLAEWLDPGTIVPGASSHPYRLEVKNDNYLKWTFEHILLPDSNVNEVASHGFVKFKIRPRVDIPLGTVIRNRAGIYFDFNPPVITNKTWHTVGENFVPVDTKSPNPLVGNILEISPNPAAGNNTRYFIKGNSIERGQAIWFNTLEQRVTTSEISDNRIVLPALLPPGLYRVQVFKEHLLLGWAKWVVVI